MLSRFNPTKRVRLSGFVSDAGRGRFSSDIMAGRMLILAVAMVLCPLAFVGPQVVTRSSRMPQLAEPKPSGTPSTSSSFSLTTFDESEENSKSASVVVYFVVGLLFPLLGGFNLGILLAALGYGLSYGSIVNFAKKNETLKEYSSSIDDVGLAGVKAGEYALKAYNFVAAKVNAAL